ncbi:MAG: ribosome silencing factor [Halothiobacillus sp. 20-54-6]|nr:MAG: ribosome silencing factor [Halothiobacillus sp. 20-54-6]
MNPEKNISASDQPVSVTPTTTEQPSPETLVAWVIAALEDLKAIDIRVLDVRGHCNFTDFMVFSSGTSDRHLKSQANSVVEKVKAHGVRPMGVEGDDVPSTEWVLVDLVDVLVHIMLPETRDHYQLEKLWSAQGSADRSGSDLSEGIAASVASVAALAGSQSAYASALDKLRNTTSGADDDVSDDWDDEDTAEGFDSDDDLGDWDEDEANGDDTPPVHRG